LKERNVNLRFAMYLELLLAIVFLSTGQAPAQPLSPSLTGTVANPSGAVANAIVTARNLATGQSLTTKTDTQGRYAFANLAPGDYEVTASPEGAVPKTARVTLAAGAKETLNLALSGNFVNAGAPSLGDLGFTPQQTTGNPHEQARLNKRSHMLKTHQRLGLITTAPLIATLVVASGAKGSRNGAPGSNASGRELHAALGGVTAGLYLTTAGFAIFAPKIQDTHTRGQIRLHKALAWIHGPGMILTPVLGSLAYQQRSNGQKIHGIAQAHGPVAIVTAAAYGLAILSVSIKF
jgi:Carboxypeptidase regulatory-like domain